MIMYPRCELDPCFFIKLKLDPSSGLPIHLFCVDNFPVLAILDYTVAGKLQVSLRLIADQWSYLILRYTPALFSKFTHPRHDGHCSSEENATSALIKIFDYIDYIRLIVCRTGHSLFILI